jgi:hypothetical protein
MFLIAIAAYRGRKAYKEKGYNQSLNPYNVGRCWDAWYWAHQEEYYKEAIPNYDPKNPPSSFYGYW